MQEMAKLLSLYATHLPLCDVAREGVLEYARRPNNQVYELVVSMLNTCDAYCMDSAKAFLLLAVTYSGYVIYVSSPFGNLYLGR